MFIQYNLLINIYPKMFSKRVMAEKLIFWVSIGQRGGDYCTLAQEDFRDFTLGENRVQLSYCFTYNLLVSICPSMIRKGFVAEKLIFGHMWCIVPTYNCTHCPLPMGTQFDNLL